MKEPSYMCAYAFITGIIKNHRLQACHSAYTLLIYIRIAKLHFFFHTPKQSTTDTLLFVTKYTKNVTNHI